MMTPNIPLSMRLYTNQVPFLQRLLAIVLTFGFLMASYHLRKVDDFLSSGGLDRMNEASEQNRIDKEMMQQEGRLDESPEAQKKRRLYDDMQKLQSQSR